MGLNKGVLHSPSQFLMIVQTFAEPSTLKNHQKWPKIEERLYSTPLFNTKFLRLLLIQNSPLCLANPTWRITSSYCRSSSPFSSHNSTFEKASSSGVVSFKKNNETKCKQPSQSLHITSVKPLYGHK